MIVQLNERLISDVATCPAENFSSLLELDLHLREDKYQGKVRKIENLSLVPNLRRLNLSYNVITKIEGLDRMVYLMELNLAENSIRKIENLDNLKSLEKLNLSGNEIERIPPNIRQLHQLNHLRIARNNLSNLEDLQHLSQLPYLTNLRFDENPFCDDPNYELFAIYHIPTLTFVNGREITDDMREEARLKFATSQRDILCSKLEAEKHKLTRLKRNLQRSPLRNESRVQESPEENELLMAQKLEEITLVEKEILRLQELIDRFDRGSPGKNVNDQSSISPSRSRAPTPSRIQLTTSRTSTNSDHSPLPLTRDYFDHLKSITTPFRSHFGGSSSSNMRTPSHSESMAAKQITELNDRVEKLASKILAAEEEKLGLKKELDARRKSDNLVARLKEELMQTEGALEKALTAAQDANMELETVRQKLSLTKHEFHSMNEDMDRCIQNNRDLSEENKQLAQENRDLLKLLESKAKKENNYASNKGMSNLRTADDQFNLLELERINLHLQAELDRHLNESTTLNQHLNRLRDELEATKMKLQQSESTTRELKLEKQFFERNIHALQNERNNLQRTIRTLESNIKGLESDLAAVIRAKTNTPMKTLSESRRMRNQSSHVKNRNNQNQNMRGTFLDTWSTESESGFLGGNNDFDGENNDGFSEQQPRYLERVSLSNGKKKKENKSPFVANPIYVQQGGLSKFSLTELERSAAEIIAHIMLEEIQQRSNASNNSNSSSPLKHSKQGKKDSLTKSNNNNNNHNGFLLRHDLKDACIRAALRLVYTTTHLIQDPDLQQAMTEELKIHSSDNMNQEYDEGISHNHAIRVKKSVAFTPFHAMGDRHVLSKLVADTHAGLSVMEEAGIIREEINQLEKLARELELRAETADQSIVEKENTLKGLQRHAEEAKRQAEDTLQELENLHKKLQFGRDEIVRLDNEQSILNREVDIARGQLKDISALSEIEQRNLQTLRNKLHDTKRDFHELDVSVSALKEENAKEEHKLRSTRASSSEQMRLLSLDVSKAQNDLKAKQRAMDDLEKQRRLLEEDMDTKKRESELYLSQLLREVDEENRKLSSFKNETRVLRNEMEALSNKKKQVEHELCAAQEKLMVEKSMSENEHLENRRKLEQDERLAQDLDRRVKTYKEKLSAYETEQIAMRHAIEELRRQQHDLDRALDQKKRSSETELQQAQQAVQFATRSLRQLSTQIEQRQHEYDAIDNDIRTLERRQEEMKRLLRDQEHRQEQGKEQQKHLDVEKTNLMKDVVQLKKEEEDLKHATLLLKTSLDTETRQLEDTRRKSLQLSQEAQHWQDSEHRNKQAYHVLQTEMETLQQEVANVRSQQDRERRILSELVSKRAFLEAEMNRQDTTFRNKQSLHQEENQRIQDMEQTVLKSIEEVNRVQTLLVTMEKKIDEAKRREEESHQREQLIKQSILKLQLEKDGLHAMYLTEKRHVDELKESSFQLQQEHHRVQEDHATLVLQAKDRRHEIDTLQKHLDHLFTVKSSLEQEIHRLQDVSKWEETRFTLVSEQYQQLEQRLHALRTELEKVQAVYEKTRFDTVEEQRRTETQRVLLQETLSEITSLELQMAQIQRQMTREKQLAMQEIGRLQHVKTLTEQEILRLGETQKRFDRYQKLQHPQLSPMNHNVSSHNMSPSSSSQFCSTHNNYSQVNNKSERSRSRSPATSSSIASKFNVTGVTPALVSHHHNNSRSNSNALGDLKQDRNRQHLIGSVAGEMLRLKVSLADSLDNTNYTHQNKSITKKNSNEEDEQTKLRAQGNEEEIDVFQRRGRWVAHHQEQQQLQNSRSVSRSRRDSLDENNEEEDNIDTARSDEKLKTFSHKNVRFSRDNNENNAVQFQQIKSSNFDTSEKAVTVENVEDKEGEEDDNDGLWAERDSLGGVPLSAVQYEDVLPQANTSFIFDENNNNKKDFKLADKYDDHHFYPNNSNTNNNIGTVATSNVGDNNNSKDCGLSALQEAMAKLRQQSEAVLAQSQHL